MKFFKNIAALFFAAALVLVPFLPCRPASAQSAPTASAELVHTPYVPFSGSYTYLGDAFRFHVRVRRHTDNTSVSPPAGGEAWVPGSVVVTWQGDYAYVPLIDVHINKTFTYTFPSANVKTKSLAPPPNGHVVTDAVGDIAFGFMSGGAPTAPPQYMLVSTLGIVFNFSHVHVVNGQVVSEAWSLKASVPINNIDGPIAVSGDITVPPRGPEDPRVAGRISGRSRSGFSLVSYGALAASADDESLGADTMSASLLTNELGDSVIAGVNTTTSAWFAANPAAYTQGAPQLTIQIPWPANVQY